MQWKNPVLQRQVNKAQSSLWWPVYLCPVAEIHSYMMSLCFHVGFLFLCTVWWHDQVCLRQRWKGEQCSRQISTSDLSEEWIIDAVVTCCFPLGGPGYCFPHSLPQDKLWAIFLCLLIFCTLLFTHWSDGFKFTFGVYVFQILFFVAFILLSSLCGFINRLLVSSLQTLDLVCFPPFLVIPFHAWLCFATSVFILCSYSCIRPGLHSPRLGHRTIIKYFIISE